MTGDKKTVPYEVKLTGSRSATICMRREADAQLFDALDSQQQDAMLAINKAFNILVAGLGMKTQDFSNLRSTTGDIEHGAKLLRAYGEWRDKLKKANIDGNLVMHIIGLGNSMNKTAEDYGISRYFVKKALVESLDLY